jgi:hypothetical protein
MPVATPPPRGSASKPDLGREVRSGISRRLARWVGAIVARRRRPDADQSRLILCLECFEAVELDEERMQRLGGRAFAECGSCANLVWIRRRDLRRAVPVGSLH